MLNCGDGFGETPCQRVVIPVIDPADRIFPAIAVAVGRTFIRIADKRLRGRNDRMVDRAHLLERMHRVLAEIGHEAIAARLQLGEERAFPG